MKLFGKGSKKMLNDVVDAEKKLAAEVLESFLDRETKATFDLNGVTIKLGSTKLKLSGKIDVTVVLPKKGK
ncbi:MAG: hypothetical protein V1836_02320 [Candidatus Aenigmatarchaeota archaeon]